MLATRFITTLMLASVCTAAAAHPKRHLVAARDSEDSVGSASQAEGSASVSERSPVVLVQPRSALDSSSGKPAPKMVKRGLSFPSWWDQETDQPNSEAMYSLLMKSQNGNGKKLRSKNPGPMGSLSTAALGSKLSTTGGGTQPFDPYANVPAKKPVKPLPNPLPQVAQPTIPTAYTASPNWPLYNATSTTLGLDFAVLAKPQRDRLVWCADHATAAPTGETETTVKRAVKGTQAQLDEAQLQAEAALQVDVKLALQLCPDLQAWSQKIGGTSAKSGFKRKPIVSVTPITKE